MGEPQLPAACPSALAPKPGCKMKITEVIQPKAVVLDLRAATKADLMRALATDASRAVALPEKAILQALSAREELGSTGIGQGIAIPHARLQGLAKAFSMAVRLKQPIEFDSIDGVPVDIVILLLIPDREGEPHVDRLACVAKQLRSKAVQDGVRRARDAAQLYSALTTNSSES